MKTKKILQLIEAVENDVLQFDFSFIRKGNCGCAIGIANKIFWNEDTEIVILGGVDPKLYFDRVEQELGISKLAGEVLFNYPSDRTIKTNKGKLKGFTEPPTKEEWLNHAREFIRIKTKDKTSEVTV